MARPGPVQPADDGAAVAGVVDRARTDLEGRVVLGQHGGKPGGGDAGDGEQHGQRERDHDCAAHGRDGRRVTPADVVFTPAHRGGSGSPLVLVHGFADTWRVWELVLPALERRHDVLAPTLPGRAGGPPLPAELTVDTLADAVAEAMDAGGLETAHLIGNSLGGYVALQLAARGRARSVVALAPAGGWEPGDPAIEELLAFQGRMLHEAKVAAPHADAIASTIEGRRRATGLVAERFEHIPPELIAHQMVGAAACTGAQRLIEHGMGRTGSSTRNGSTARCGSSGAPRTDCCRGPRRPRATGADGSPSPTGSSSKTSATAPSSTSRWRPGS